MNWVDVLLSSARKAISPASSILHSRMIMVCCLPEHVMEIRSLGFTSCLFFSHRTFWHSLSSSTQKMAVSFMNTAVFRGSFLMIFPLNKKLIIISKQHTLKSLATLDHPDYKRTNQHLSPNQNVVDTMQTSLNEFLGSELYRTDNFGLQREKSNLVWLQLLMFLA